ncbi:MAG: anaerobic ribonucleoside-triphosphate reductase activating protein [Candidatus Diapherotrites archaeon]|nr:anaerobic ribonucleoside-triphosphate reductase activating protein [Candidatus Diapherotrites archaeon]
MEFYGFNKVSLIDYPGKVAAVLFTGGCNFRCPYCQNKDLVLHWKKLPKHPEKEVLGYLKKRKRWVDGIVVTGGEPLMWRDLGAFLKKVKKLGLSVKLDTNGSDPQHLQELMKKRLVDYVALDVKTALAWGKYRKLVNDKQLFENVVKTISILLNQKRVDYEFRTTFAPGIVSKEDVLSLAKQLRGAKAYYLQQFIPRNCLNPQYNKVKPLPDDELKAMADSMKAFYKKVGIRL